LPQASGGPVSAMDAPLPPMGVPDHADTDALPSADSVLDNIATGIWRWFGSAGSVILDAVAARLLGLPEEPVKVSVSAIRARFHPEDWNEIDGIVHLAYTEGTVAEGRFRVMDESGHEVR